MSKGSSSTPEVAPEVASKAAESDAETAQRSMLNVMGDIYKAEKRVPVKVRSDGDVFVQVNGYSFLIKPNVKVEVPESLVTILEEGGYI